MNDQPRMGPNSSDSKLWQTSSVHRSRFCLRLLVSLVVVTDSLFGRAFRLWRHTCAVAVAANRWAPVDVPSRPGSASLRAMIDGHSCFSFRDRDLAVLLEAGRTGCVASLTGHRNPSTDHRQARLDRMTLLPACGSQMQGSTLARHHCSSAQSPFFTQNLCHERQRNRKHDPPEKDIERHDDRKKIETLWHPPVVPEPRGARK